MSKLISMKPRVLALLAASILVVAALSVGILNSRILTKESANKVGSAQKLSVARSKATPEKQAAKSTAYNKLMIESKMSEFGTKVNTLEAALSQISVKPKLPDAAVAGNPKEIFVIGAPSPAQTGIGIEYENGMEIWIRPNKPVPDYDTDMKTFSRVKPIDVNGFKGTCADFDKKVFRMGEVAEIASVVWYEDSTEYYVYGDKAGQLRLKDLIPVARSMH